MTSTPTRDALLGGMSCEVMGAFRDSLRSSVEFLAALSAQSAAGSFGDGQRECPGARPEPSVVAVSTRSTVDLAGVLCAVQTEDLAGLFEELLALRALAEGVSVAVVEEAVARGVIDAADPSRRPVGAKITTWVGERADHAGVPVTPGVAASYRRFWENSRRRDAAPLRAAVHAGRVSVAVAARLGRDLDILSASIPGEMYDHAATILIGQAAHGASAGDLASVKEALIANYGPDGEFEAQQAAARRHRFFTTPVKDAAGMWVGSYAMDNDSYSAVAAALDALAAPTPSEDGQYDTRTPEARNLDAIVELCRVVATDPTLLGHVRPVSAARAQVTVTIDHDVLATRLRAVDCACDDHDHGHAAHTSTGDSSARAVQRYGVDGHGTPLPPSVVRRLACDADLIPAVLGADSAILDLGRTARVATPDQIRYLRLRDKGCTFPGCTRPPGWCEAHHLDEWDTDQGPTDVDNLTLLCTRHHVETHTHHLKGHLIDGAIRWHRRTTLPT